MDAVSYAINRIKNAIPAEILNIVFTQNRTYRGVNNSYNAQSIDEAIRREVIENKVRIDIDPYSGTEIDIPLRRCEIESENINKHIIRVPDSLTQGRHITSVKHLSFIDLSGDYVSGSPSTFMNNSSSVCGNGLLVQGANSILSNVEGVAVTSTADIYVIGDNILLAEGVITAFGSIRVKISYDEGFSQLPVTVHPRFGELCVLACKSYIYNHLAIRMDAGILFSGETLGKIKEIVDSYSDSEELYHQFIEEKWRVTSHFADKRVRRRMLGLRLSRHL